jgi:hypothetical protein
MNKGQFEKTVGRDVKFDPPDVRQVGLSREILEAPWSVSNIEDKTGVFLTKGPYGFRLPWDSIREFLETRPTPTLQLKVQVVIDGDTVRTEVISRINDLWYCPSHLL